jgi:hypothetical protein
VPFAGARRAFRVSTLITQKGASRLRSCLHNPTHRLPDVSDPRRVYCSTTCRTAAHRARQKVAESDFRAAAAALVFRQTAAIQSHDADALAQLQREAAELFKI